jgi:hypothetical protein
MRVLEGCRRARPLFGGGVKAPRQRGRCGLRRLATTISGEIALMSAETCRGASECPRMAETPSEQ